MLAALFLGLLLTATGVARAQTVSATIAVGSSPNAVAINPVTNKIYVVNNADGTVSVIDGATNNVATVTVGSDPVAVGVDPVTDMIYVANETADTVSVINGVTNAVTTVNLDVDPDAVAVDSVTDTIYVANKCGTDSTCTTTGTVSVINGATGSVSRVGVGSDPVALSVNPVTNTIYVVNEGSNNVSVIDGSTDGVTSISVGYTPDAVAVDPATNRAFVVNKCGTDSACGSTGTISVIGGSTLSTTVSVGTAPSAIAVDPAADVVYVLNQISGTPEVTLIDGSLLSVLSSVPTGTSPVGIAASPSTDQAYVVDGGGNSVTVVSGTSYNAQSVNVGASPSALAINPVTNKIYVANQNDGTVTVIDGTPDSFVRESLVSSVSGLQLIAIDPATNKAYLINGNAILVVDATTYTLQAAFNVGTQPVGLGVNPVTNTIYVANEQSNNVSVIDGATNTVTATVNVGVAPVRVAVDPITNKIYVTNWCDNQASCSGAPSTVSVIGGATNTVSSTVTVGYQPYEIAANPATDKIYVLNLCGSGPYCTGDANVSVIDGRTDTVTATVPVQLSPTALAVDPANDKIYVANSCGNDSTCSSDGTVSIIDGATNSTTVLPVGPLPQALAVNPANNEIDVLNSGPRNNSTCSSTLPGSVWAINGTTNQVTASVNVGSCPLAMSVNPATNRIYVVNYDKSVSVIDGITHTVEATLNLQTFNALPDPINGELYAAYAGSGELEVYPGVYPGVPSQLVPLTTSIAGFADNVTLSPTPTFTFTTSSTFSPVAPPIQHVYYQVDTLQGPWLEATGSAPDFTGVSPTLTRGSHILYAFATDGEDATSTGVTADMIGTMSTYVFTVSGASTTTTLTADSSSIVQSYPVTFTASVTSSATGTPTGTVTFMDGTTVLGTGTLDSGGSATLTTSALPAGTNSITALYSGDANFLPSTSPSLKENVLATTTTTLSPVSATTYGTSVTLSATVTSSASGTPTGAVTFLDGTKTLGTGTLNSSAVATFTTSLLAGGSHSLTASYGGDTTFAPSTSSTVTFTVNPAATTAKVASSLNPSFSGDAVTFSASVTSSAGTPTGTVTFDDGSTQLGTGTLDSSGQANFSTSTLAAGSHSITAAYVGSADFSPSTSAALSETVNTAAFTLSIPNSSATVQAGQSANFTMNVTPEGKLASAIDFACSGLPSEAGCSFSPASLTLGSSASQDTLTISTTAPSTSGLLPLGLPGRPSWPLFAAIGLLAGLALLLTRKREQPARRKLRRLVWAGTLALAIGMTLAACGGGGSSSSSSGGSSSSVAGTPAGTYTVTVTGTSGSQDITAQVSLTVQ